MKLIAIASLAAGLALAGAASAAPNLITNGDFSAGNTGFSSDYTFGPPPSLMGEGVYTIGADPHDFHPFWVDVAGSNPMLIFNGATTGDEVAWQEDNIATTVGGQYNFSASVMDICCNGTFDPNTNAPSDLEFQVSTDNGMHWQTIVDYTTTPGGDTTHPSGDEGILVTVTGNFDSAPGGHFDIRAIDGDSAAGGNDFALDNISVTAAPEPATWGLMILGVGMVGGALRFSRKSQRPALVRIA